MSINLLPTGIKVVRTPPTEEKTTTTNRNRKEQRVRQSMQAQSCDTTHAEVTLQDSAVDLVGIAPAQDQSSQTDMQEGQ